MKTLTHIASTYLDDEMERCFKIWLKRQSRHRADGLRLLIQRAIEADAAEEPQPYRPQSETAV